VSAVKIPFRRDRSAAPASSPDVVSGRLLFTVVVLAVFVAAIVYTALCARSVARADAELARVEPARDDVVVTDAAIARLLESDAATTSTAA
jgi:hypothetical protein